MYHEFAPLQLLRLAGFALAWLGALFLLFGAFQAWGTEVLEWHAQRRLDGHFEQLVTGPTADHDDPLIAADDGRAAREVPGDRSVEARVAPPVKIALAQTTASAEPRLIRLPAGSNLLPPEGAPIARIDIPAIGVRKTIVQGISRPSLRAGPGHYPTTPMPGQPGNAAIAGHRTTHGSPFLDLDLLQPGDRIEVETFDGVFRYEVVGHRAPDGSEQGHLIVPPSVVSVLADHGDDRLTLTACHPRYSARERIIVTAVLIDEPLPGTGARVAAASASPSAMRAWREPAVLNGSSPIGDLDPATVGHVGHVEGVHSILDDPIEVLDESLGWRMEELDFAVLWAVVTAQVAFAGWVLGRVWRRRWVYPLAAPIGAVSLFVCFIHIDRLLPAY